jgi:hypothetical protein
VIEILLDVPDQGLDRPERAAPDGLAGEDPEPGFDEVELGGRGRREVALHARAGREPRPHLVHYPLTAGHPLAFAAAVAGECAARQGRLIEFSDTMFTHQGALAKDTLLQVRLLKGRLPPMDSVAFAQCTDLPSTSDLVSQGRTLLTHEGVVATPTLLIGDTLYPGTPSSDELIHLLRKRSLAGEATRQLSRR